VGLRPSSASRLAIRLQSPQPGGGQAGQAADVGGPDAIGAAQHDAQA
jgi:hypothetical protein